MDRVVTVEPPNLEIAPLDVVHEITPIEGFFVRCHDPPPYVDVRTHRLRVDGLVATPLELSMGELYREPMRSVTVTLECAGNDRVDMVPLPHGELWHHGAVSTASWRGVPLEALLRKAGLRDDVVEIAAYDVEGRFARALPVEKALDPDTLVTLEMNGRPLPIVHGAPVRLVVPGWYGMASVKWLARLEARSILFHGHYQTEAYVYDAEHPVTTIRVKSHVVYPVENGVVTTGPLTVWGWAWSGDGAITSVEVALDGNDRWHPTRLTPSARHGWTRFDVAVMVEAPGRHALRSRAADVSGHRQPDLPPWNAGGYGNNAIRPILFTAR